ncbi:TPA: hypothetical protein ACHTH4_004789 [Escherichia coli]
MKRCLLAIIVAAALSSQVHAIGIPVLDATQVAGQLRELSQGLRDYEQYLKQTALSNSDLLEAYKRYDQMLSDYKQVLREAQALKRQLQGIDLQNFLNDLKQIDMYDPRYASGDDPNVGSKPWDDAVERNKLLNGWGMSDEEWSEMNAAIPYTSNDRDRAKAIFQYRKRKAEGAIRQDLASRNFDKSLIEQTARADEMASALDELGDNDTLATQQLMARQNQMIIEQNLNIQAQKNTDFKMSNQIANDYFNNMAKERARKEKAMSKAYKGED